MVSDENQCFQYRRTVVQFIGNVLTRDGYYTRETMTRIKMTKEEFNTKYHS